MTVIDLFQNTAVTTKDAEGLLAIILERVNHTMVVYVHVTKVLIKSIILVGVSANIHTEHICNKPNIVCSIIYLCY